MGVAADRLRLVKQVHGIHVVGGAPRGLRQPRPAAARGRHHRDRRSRRRDRRPRRRLRAGPAARSGEARRRRRARRLARHRGRRGRRGGARDAAGVRHRGPPTSSRPSARAWARAAGKSGPTSSRRSAPAAPTARRWPRGSRQARAIGRSWISSAPIAISSRRPVSIRTAIFASGLCTKTHRARLHSYRGDRERRGTDGRRDPSPIATQRATRVRLEWSQRAAVSPRSRVIGPNTGCPRRPASTPMVPSSR